MKPNPMDQKILDHLAYVKVKDGERGGIGYRSTREVADYAHIDIHAARRALLRLVTAKTVDGFVADDWQVLWGAS